MAFVPSTSMSMSPFHREATSAMAIGNDLQQAGASYTNSQDELMDYQGTIS